MRAIKPGNGGAHLWLQGSRGSRLKSAAIPQSSRLPYDIGAVYYDWDDKAIQLLKDCLDEASAKIVISSGWRDFNNEEKLKALFKIHDLDSYIIDVLPKGNKETVIADYLRNAGCIATTSTGRNTIDKYPLWSYYNK